jgi:hypothetical protein
VPRMGIAHHREVITCIFRASGRVDVPKRTSCSGPSVAAILWVLPGTHYVQHLSGRAFMAMLRVVRAVLNQD